VRIKGIAANYQGSMQIKMKSLAKVDDATVDIANFLEASPRNTDDMVKELKAAASSLTNTHLRQLMNAFLNDTVFLELFKRTPAAKTLHHNYIGGLCEHIVELVALARDVAKHFPSVDLDLLITGAFLHDIGKVKELSVRKAIVYTTEGRLLGHISLGYEMVADKIKTIPGFPDELTMLLKHIMLSHHGEYEYGSPKRPKIREAIIINYLDDLAAKINNFDSTLKKERVEEGEWTGFSKMHDRYLYRQMVNSVPSEGPEDAEEKPHSSAKSKKAAHGVDADKSGKLPLDI
jgi:3'-5' exoribonuclease